MPTLPTLPTLRIEVPPATPTPLEQLQAEVTALRSREYIGFIEAITDPVVVHGVGDHPHGPWKLEFAIAAPATSVYAMTPVRGRVQVDGMGTGGSARYTAWFRGIVQHYLLDSGTSQLDFLDEDAPVVTLTHFFEELHGALAGPIHPCPDCDAAYEHHSRAHAGRLGAIARYSPERKHPDLFTGDWAQECFDPRFWAALQPPPSGDDVEAAAAAQAQRLDGLLRQEAPGVYSFPMLSPFLCDMLLDELDHFAVIAEERGLAVQRPNSMNKYGVIVNEIGLEQAIDALLARYLQPIASRLFPVEGRRLDRHHSFVVQYQPGKDTHLDMHTDDADVTFNVCLGRDFEASGLTFCGGIGTPGHRKHTLQYPHVTGRCVVHLGTRRHGADVITRGERANLIIWAHNDAFRASALYNAHKHGANYTPESAAPDPLCLSYTHDRDFGVFKEYTPEQLPHRGSGWCPPESCEYPGFKAEATALGTE